MKNRGMKAIACLFLAVVIGFGGTLTVFAEEEQTTTTYTNASELAKFTFKGYNNGSLPAPTTTLGLLEYTLETFVMGDEYNGPIGIVEATLNQNGEEKPVYIVALSGTELIWSDYTGIQSTGAVTDLLCGFNLDNPYIKAVRNAMINNIPSNADVIFYGHSLGGMIAQEAAADSTIKRNYNILNTVTYGSPLIKLLSRFMSIIYKKLKKANDLIVLFGNDTYDIILYHDSPPCSRREGGLHALSGDSTRTVSLPAQSFYCVCGNGRRGSDCSCKKHRPLPGASCVWLHRISGAGAEPGPQDRLRPDRGGKGRSFDQHGRPGPQ